MAVMAAGVHDAVDEGRIGAVEFFRQRQGVDIGPQEDDRTGQGAVQSEVLFDDRGAQRDRGDCHFDAARMV